MFHFALPPHKVRTHTLTHVELVRACMHLKRKCVFARSSRITSARARTFRHVPPHRIYCNARPACQRASVPALEFTHTPHTHTRSLAVYLSRCYLITILNLLLLPKHISCVYVCVCEHAVANARARPYTRLYGLLDALAGSSVPPYGAHCARALRSASNYNYAGFGAVYH